ncbi:helix-turn-helix domain-containing protein [Winogradskyella sp.]|uniref:helix-turn-helix domain-containing protein n=1 Tax=Winogradskyella sp. TaxID=1883156 RepID=UPI00261728D9|nr:helix-turn-helix domain-containing protein [Winogradskyella sp.]
MNYKEKYTEGFISNFIKSFWEFETSDMAYHYEILPDGFFDLIFEIKKEQITRISLTGVWTKQIQTSIPENTKLIGIRFKLISAEYIFRQSIKEFKNTKTDLPITFWGCENFDFSDFARFTDSITEKLQYGLKNLKEIDNRKLKLFKIVYKHKGEITVQELSEKLIWSSRQINRYFNSRFGFSLKTFCNVLKCHSSLKHIAKGELFPASGYYDQAHFIKQVKQITGSTPTNLYLNKNDRFLQLSILHEK